MKRILGLDPGLVHTGWGMIEMEGNTLRYLAHGVLSTHPSKPLGERLSFLYKGVCDVIDLYTPHCVAIEDIFLNKNPHSTLKLGMARGTSILAAAMYSLPLNEYGANKIKKTVVGVGHADKGQIAHMLRYLLPQIKGTLTPDAADALAVAICHTHHMEAKRVF